MDDRQDSASTHQDDSPPQQHTEAHNENETQRLHRLVIPMILDILRSRGEHRHAPRDNTAQSLWNGIENTRNEEEPPPLITSDDSPADSMDVDEGRPAQRTHTHSATGEGDHEPMVTDQQGQLLPSPDAATANAATTETDGSSSLSTPSSSSSPSAPRRPRYRLVVYFEEREPLNDGGSNADPSSSPSEDTQQDGEPSFIRSQHHPSNDTTTTHTHRPSRYVAIFSIDSDAHNMPIIHSAGLQPSPASFEDILNQLFTSYMPKGTPPAKKEIIDSLPTATFSQDTCASQPKCAVCLEEFAEGAEVVVLPCSHRFHGEDCVKPWLRMHSSCPVCRYEMPVDDIEYEEQRKERMAKRTVPSTNDTQTHTQHTHTQQDVTFDDPPLL